MMERKFTDEQLEMTKDELLKDDEFDADDEFVTEEEFSEHVGEIHEMFTIYATGIILSRMFDDGKITLGQYLELTDYMEEYEQDLDVSVI